MINMDMKRMSYGYDLPEELQEQILLRLPVKTLLRFRTVCRSWNSLITEPRFVKDHLAIAHKTKSTSSNSTFLIASNKNRTWEQDCLLTISDDCVRTYEEIYVPPVREVGVFSAFVSECNGIVCRVNDMWLPGQRAVFYNPALRQHRSLLLSGETMLGYGFGHDLKSDDYKFIQISVDMDFQCTVGVYSLRSGSWREFEISEESIPHGDGVYANGHCYWPCSRSESIVSYDMSADKFGVLNLPPSDRSKICPLLMGRGESLVCVVDAVEVWVMEFSGGGGVWVKQSELDAIAGDFFRPMAFWKEDKFFAMIKSPRSVRSLDTFLYNFRTKKNKRIPFMRNPRLYVESLVWVD